MSRREDHERRLGREVEQLRRQVARLRKENERNGPEQVETEDGIGEVAASVRGRDLGRNKRRLGRASYSSASRFSGVESAMKCPNPRCGDKVFEHAKSDGSGSRYCTGGCGYFEELPRGSLRPPPPERHDPVPPTPKKKPRRRDG